MSVTAVSISYILLSSSVTYISFSVPSFPLFWHQSLSPRVGKPMLSSIYYGKMQHHAKNA